jgi:hypothetical protein
MCSFRSEKDQPHRNVSEQSAQNYLGRGSLKAESATKQKSECRKSRARLIEPPQQDDLDKLCEENDADHRYHETYEDNETHRSHSPNTTSIAPKMAVASGSM